MRDVATRAIHLIYVKPCAFGEAGIAAAKQAVRNEMSRLRRLNVDIPSTLSYTPILAGLRCAYNVWSRQVHCNRRKCQTRNFWPLAAIIDSGLYKPATVNTVIDRRYPEEVRKNKREVVGPKRQPVICGTSPTAMQGEAPQGGPAGCCRMEGDVSVGRS